MEGGRSFPITRLTFQVRKINGAWVVVVVLGGGGGLGLGFGTGLGLDNLIFFTEKVFYINKPKQFSFRGCKNMSTLTLLDYVLCISVT